MITLVQFAETIETGLNSALNEVGIADIEFKVWATAGQLSDAVRTGNTIENYITANLTSDSSSNDENILVMGYNGLTLQFALPIKAPRTSAAQTVEALARVKNSQYPFVDLVLSAVDSYFQRSLIFSLKDGDTNYTVTMTAGRSLTGNVDLAAELSETVLISISIDVYFLEGGINSLNVVLYVDGVRVPFQTLRIGRSNTLASEQYSGEESVKNISTASAISLDFAFPANADNTTQESVLTLLQGQLNRAHFVRLQFGTETEQYLMMLDGLMTNAQGATFAGISGSLLEVVENPLMLDFPEYVQVGRFAFADSQTETLTFTVTDCTGYISGEVRDFSGAQAVTLSADDFWYSSADDTYYVYFVTLGAATVTNANATFSIIQEAQNG